MAKEYIAKESTSQAILTKATETDTAVDGIVGKVGETNDSSGSTTSGGIFAKLNKVITDTTSLLTRLTTVRAASLDRIGSSEDSGSDTLFGILKAGLAVKSIQYQYFTIASKGLPKTVSISSVNPERSIVIIQGTSHDVSGYTHGLVLSSFSETSIKITGFENINNVETVCAIQVIEFY